MSRTTYQSPVPCLHCAEELRGTRSPRIPPTLFVRHHPFKPGWEVRRCRECRRDSAYSQRVVA